MPADCLEEVLVDLLATRLPAKGADAGPLLRTWIDAACELIARLPAALPRRGQWIALMAERLIAQGFAAPGHRQDIVQRLTRVVTECATRRAMNPASPP